MSTLLGTAVAATIPTSDQMTYICLPTGISRSLLDTIVKRANANIERDDEPFAVLVSRVAGTREHCTSPSEVVKYRLGRRCFVWEDGEFDPDHSFSTSVKPFISAGFPDKAPDEVLDRLSDAIVRVIVDTNALRMKGNAPVKLSQHISAVLRFLVEALGRIGNAEISWQLAWWKIVERGVEALSAVVDEGHTKARLVYGAFGLPAPRDGEAYTLLDGKAYRDAVEGGWGSKDEALRSIRRLEIETNSACSLSVLVWSSYEASVDAVGHIALGLTSLGPERQRVDAWAGIDEVDFLGRASTTKPGAITATVGGSELPGPPGDINPAYVVPLGLGSFEAVGTRNGKWVLPELTLTIPWRSGSGGPASDDQQKLGVEVDVAPLRFEVVTQRLVPNGLELVGRLEYAVKTSGTWPTKPIAVSVSGKDGENLPIWLDEQAECRFLLPDPWRAPSIFVAFEEKAGPNGDKSVHQRRIECRAGGRYKASEASLTPNAEPMEEKIQLAREQAADIWSVDGRSTSANFSLLDIPAEARSSEVKEYTRTAVLRTVQLRDGLRIFPVASDEAVLSVMVNVKEPHPWSPVVAAALGQSARPMSETVPPQWKLCMRGVLESLYGEVLAKAQADPPSFTAGLGHVILPTGLGTTPPASLFGAGVIAWPREFPVGGGTGMGAAGTGPSQLLLESAETARFREALRAVAVGLPPLSSRPENWPSRCSLLTVPEDAINSYLDAFAALVDKATRCEPRDLFWASCPFSAIIFDRQSIKVKAVLLSPLHPLRLAWLYACEKGFLEAGAVAPALSQILEGWNFPWMAAAPAPGGNPAMMAALPIDPGPERIFLGWSMLVAFDNAEGSRPTVPTWAAGLRVPAGAASGLNEGAVVAAVRDYLRVNPHLTTLSIDLFSQTPSARSAEVDSAVLAAVADITPSEGYSRLLGGVRVFDSLAREGTIPSWETAVERAGTDGELLGKLEWRRYSPLTPVDSNVRLVEDAHVELTRVQGEALGVTPMVPFKRHLIRSGGSGELIEGVISAAAAATPFLRALRSVECPQGQEFALHVTAPTLLGASPTADWVVTGNTFVEPAALGAALAQEGQVLWEWRPGFLARPNKSDRSAALTARPYTTIAKIPAALQNAICQHLNITEGEARLLFAELGKRGVGLASLLAMGANHVQGALGFFSAFRLLDTAPTAGIRRLVMPIDAVDPVLRAIAGRNGTDSSSKRADLLLLELDNNGKDCWIIPVEIRCSSSTQGQFPNANGSEVREKASQLKNSLAVLNDVVAAVRGAASSQSVGEHALVSAAFSTLVETGLLLSPGAPRGRLASDLLRAITTGEASLHCQRGLVLWFQDTGKRASEFHQDAPEQHVGTVFVSAGSRDPEIWGTESGPLSTTLNFAVEWCRGIDLVKGPLIETSPSQDPAPSTKQETVLPVVKKADTQPSKSAPRLTELRVHVGEASGHEVNWEPEGTGSSRLNNAHTVILGSSGSGKTQALLSFIAQASEQGVVPLILDFKDDYVDSAFLQNIGARLFSAEDGLPVAPLILEPDKVANRVNVPQLVYSVAEVLRKVHNLGDQQQAALREALFKTFEVHGIPRDQRGPVSSSPPFASLKVQLDAIGNQKLSARLSPLFDLRLFDSGDLSLSEIIRQPSVIRLSQLPSEEVKKFAAEILLRGIYSTILKQGHKRHVELMLVIDEAHKVANLEAVKLLMKEARAYGVAVFLSSQQASDFDDFVFANAGSMLALKLSETKDSERVARLLGGAKDATRLADQLRSLPTFEGFWKNDHHRPFSRVRVLPYFERGNH